MDVPQVDQSGFPPPARSQWPGRVSADWQVVVYPTSYLVDAAGEIRYQVTGTLEWDAPAVVQVIEAMMDEVPSLRTDPAPASVW